MGRSRAASRVVERYATDAVFHETGDIVVAEFTYRGVTGTGAPVARRCVHVTTVRDGLIVTSRDYQAAIAK